MRKPRKPVPSARTNLAVPVDVARRLRLASGARDLTIGQYIAALVSLHETMRECDGTFVRAELKRLGLETVTT